MMRFFYGTGLHTPTSLVWEPKVLHMSTSYANDGLLYKKNEENTLGTGM